MTHRHKVIDFKWQKVRFDQVFRLGWGPSSNNKVALSAGRGKLIGKLIEQTYNDKQRMTQLNVNCMMTLNQNSSMPLCHHNEATLFWGGGLNLRSGIFTCHLLCFCSPPL